MPGPAPILDLESLITGINPTRAAAFMRRVMRLTYIHARSRPNDLGRFEWPHVIRVGIYLAYLIDIAGGRVSEEERKHIFAAVWGETDAVTAKGAIRCDIPRYCPPRTERLRCPGFTGPRGGQCRGRALLYYEPYIINRATGEWVDAAFCPAHAPAARAIAAAAPKPPTNSGGVLQAVFPEIKWDGFLERLDLAKHVYEPTIGTEEAPTPSGPPRLHIVRDTPN